MNRKPRILLLVDYRGLSHEINARGMMALLGDRYDFELARLAEAPDLAGCALDLAIVFFWGAPVDRHAIPRARLARVVASHRWHHPYFGVADTAAFVDRYLADAAHVLAVSRRLVDELSPHRPARWFPFGVDPALFCPPPARSGPVRIGWSGRIADPSKGVIDVLRPAAGDDIPLVLADGDVPHAEMPAFYQGIDVLTIASESEGGPIPLIEAMACGCFPVTVDVGIVPELVRHGRDGLIVPREPGAFREAFEWCLAHPDAVRSAGNANAERIRRERSWAALRAPLVALLDALLDATPPGRFTIPSTAPEEVKS